MKHWPKRKTHDLSLTKKKKNGDNFNNLLLCGSLLYDVARSFAFFLFLFLVFRLQIFLLLLLLAVRDMQF